MNLYEFIAALAAIPTVDGFEKRGSDRTRALCTAYADGFFDGCETLPSGSLLFSRLCGKQGAKALVLDAHLDTIGFAVSELCPGGFVKAAPLGGVDPLILPAAPVTLYGTKTLYGVFTSVPPHLAAKDSGSLKISDLYIDTGLSDTELEKAVSVGTPVGFAEPPVLLKNRVIASHSLDDKACIAAVFHACRRLAKAGTFPAETDVYVHLSTGEEKSGAGGKTLLYARSSAGKSLAEADAALVLDVNFARAPGVHDYEALALGQGPGVSYSATIKRAFTDFVVQTAEKHALPLQTVVEMRSTGTNATQIHRGGIPCAVLSLPLANMHTYSECVSLTDIETCAELAANILTEFHLSDIGEVHFK